MKNNTLFITEKFDKKKVLGQLKLSDKFSLILENYLKDFLIAQKSGIKFDKKLVIKPSGIKLKDTFELCDIGLFIDE